MRVLLIVLGVLVVIVIIGIVSDRNSVRKIKHDKELKELRLLTDKLLDMSLDSADIEPFARIVYDEIRTSRRKSIQ